jgi:dTDP-4-amino-4,6-dideoxygalactose transaminase
VHSVEGGLVFSQDQRLLERMGYMRNFGHDGPDRYNGVGINAKNSEFHAAMGACVLEDIDAILDRRKQQCNLYDELLKDLGLTKQRIQEGCRFNHAYYPVLFANETVALSVKTELERNHIFPRRYFYPSLSTLEYVESTSTVISDNCASRILCLPLYHELEQYEQKMISEIIKKALSL